MFLPEVTIKFRICEAEEGGSCVQAVDSDTTVHRPSGRFVEPPVF